jgi:hypothetical protein
MPQAAKKANNEPPVFTRGKLIVLSLIFLYIVILLSREFPFFKWQQEIKEATNNYVLFVGLDQSYTVFAPPPEFNLHFFAIVTRRSGLMEIWQYPRMDNLSLWDKLFKERYRKFLNDNLSLGALRSHLPALAQYIARQKQNAHDEPYVVSIFYVLRPIRLPEQDAPVGTDNDNKDDYNPVLRRRVTNPYKNSEALAEGVHCLITYFVRPEDLR